jgi:hypothetical protein
VRLTASQAGWRMLLGGGMTSIRYSKHGPALVEAGYDITPVKGKAAYLPGWSSRPPEALHYDAHASASIGVLTGGAHNLVAVDVLCPFLLSVIIVIPVPLIIH